VSEQFDASELRVAPAPQTIDFIAGFRAIRGRLFFGSFLLAKQKKGTRQRRKLFKQSLLQAKHTSRCHGKKTVVTAKAAKLSARQPHHCSANGLL
jgi:hypothetical protein